MATTPKSILMPRSKYNNGSVSKGVSFTQETTLSGYKTESTAKAVKELGYRVRLFYVALDTATESLSRIENRVRRGGHDIPHDDVLRRFSGRWEAIAKVLPYCDEAEFYDNDNGLYGIIGSKAMLQNELLSVKK